MVQLPADAWTLHLARTPSYVGPPGMYYMNERNLGDYECAQSARLIAQHCSTLDMYYNAMHWGGSVARRYFVRVRAGSGLSGENATDECETDEGPVPFGIYSQTDDDDTSGLAFMYKTWGDQTVTGWVWYMGNKRCNGGTGIERTGLFIHSQDRYGWQEDNYRSRGCIKIDQVDRAFMANAYRTAYSNTRGRIVVE